MVSDSSSTRKFHHPHESEHKLSDANVVEFLAYKIIAYSVL